MQTSGPQATSGRAGLKAGTRARRRLVTALGAVSAFGLVLTGCAGQADPGSNTADRSCPTIAEKPTKGNGTVSYWSMWSKGEPQQKVLQKTFDCFTQETGIKVDAQWFGRTVLTQNVAPSLNTDKVPDVIDQDVSQVNAAVAAPGGLQPVDDVMDMKVGEGDKTVSDVMADSYYDLPANKLPDGGQMLVPYETLTNAWWYNKADAGGFQQPKTTGDLFALFDAAKKGDSAAIAQDGDIDFYNAYFFTQWAEQFVGPGGVLAAARDKTGQAWKSEKGFLEAAKLVERVAKGGYLIDGWDASKFPNVQNRWADGESKYIFVGSWVTSEAGEYLKKQSGGAATESFEFGSFPMPQAEGATHTVAEQMPIGFGVTKDAKNADAAKALIAYALNKQNIEPISTVAQNLVPREDIEAPKGLTEVKARLEDSSVQPVIFMDGVDGQEPDFTKEVFYPLDNALLKGEITAEQFIDQLAAKSQAFHKS